MHLLYLTSLSVIMTFCLILGFQIILLDRKSKVNLLFFINTLLLELVMISTFAIQLSPSPEMAVIIQGVYNIILILFLGGSLAFYLVFSAQKLPLWLTAILILSGILIFIPFLSAPATLLNIQKTDLFWVYELTGRIFWFAFYTPYLFLLGFLMLFYLARYRKQNVPLVKKKMSTIMSLSTLFAYGGGFVFLMILPGLGIYKIPLLTPYFFALYLFGIFYAITRYKLMNHTLSTIAPLALSIIHDIVILTDPELKILSANKNLLNLFSYNPESIKGLRLEQLLIYSQPAVTQLQEMINGKQDAFSGRLEFSSVADVTITDARFLAVKDEFGELNAVLITCQENKGIFQFQKAYKLTPREMEILNLVTTGTTGRQIAEKMGITERTVETHLNNIYNKTGVKGKFELLRTASDFNIK